MTISIYSPQVQAYARLHNVSDLQAYRALKSRDELQRREAEGRKRRQTFTERMLGISPDWDRY